MPNGVGNLESFSTPGQILNPIRITIIITIIFKWPMSKWATGQWESFSSGWIFGYNWNCENHDSHCPLIEWETDNDDMMIMNDQEWWSWMMIMIMIILAKRVLPTPVLFLDQNCIRLDDLTTRQPPKCHTICPCQNHPLHLTPNITHCYIMRQNHEWNPIFLFAFSIYYKVLHWPICAVVLDWNFYLELSLVA